jgi:protein-S-isoprenylcysteine O-methyltransferase Ste14
MLPPMHYRGRPVIMAKRPRILPPVYLLLAILLMFALHYLVPIRHVIAWPWRWIGVALIVAALSFGCWAFISFSRHKTTIIPGEVSTRLMTDGPFQLSRNPIYFGMIFILAGVAIWLGSLSPWIAIPFFVWMIRRNIIPVEEAMLAEAFGDDYKQYQQRVRRWI